MLSSKMTKCGRYGATAAEHDYSPTTIRRSVERSLSRLNTDYLDAVYLHDVEFVCTEVLPHGVGNHLAALTTAKEQYGLLEGQEAKIWGKGDEIILDAVAELRKMKQEGLIKSIGITGNYRFFLHYHNTLIDGLHSQDTHCLSYCVSPSSCCTLRHTSHSMCF